MFASGSGGALIPDETVYAILGGLMAFNVAGVAAGVLSFTRFRYSLWVLVAALTSIGLAVFFGCVDGI